MLGIILQIFEHAAIGVCLSSLSLVFFSLAVLLRMFPSFLKFVRSCLRAALILSYRFYDLIFKRLDPLVANFGIEVTSGFPRIIASVVLSSAFGLSILAFTGLPVSGWVLIICVLHGLTIGLAWDEVEEPDGLKLGEKSE